MDLKKLTIKNIVKNKNTIDPIIESYFSLEDIELIKQFFINKNIVFRSVKLFESNYSNITKVLHLILIIYPQYENNICLLKLIVNNLSLKHCKTCNNLLSYKKLLDKRPCSNYCSRKCCYADEEYNNLRNNKIENTLEKRYGIKHASQMNDYKIKTIATSLERYGTEFASQSIKFRKKVQTTNKLKYRI